jgi:hypothetical protein
LKNIFSHHWVLALLIFINPLFWFGLIHWFILIAGGGYVHGEQIFFYPKNIISSIHSAVGLLAIVGLFWKIKRLYLCLVIYAVLGSLPPLLNFTFDLGYLVALSLFGVLYGGCLWGYFLLKNKS